MGIRIHCCIAQSILKAQWCHYQLGKEWCVHKNEEEKRQRKALCYMTLSLEVEYSKEGFHFTPLLCCQMASPDVSCLAHYQNYLELERVLRTVAPFFIKPRIR